ncbi:MAG: TolC family protein [Polyangiales bacterium]
MTVGCDWKRQVRAIVVALATMLVPGVAAAEVVTLGELEELALQNQARWEAVEATSAQADAQLDVARSGKNPTFWMNAAAEAAPGSYIEKVQNVSGDVVNVRASPTIGERTAFRPNVRYEGTIEMNAPLYDSRARAAIRSAEAHKSAARANSHASRQNILIVVRGYYLDWMAKHLIHDLASSSVEDAKTQRERTAARVAEGDRPGSELDAALYEELQAELVEADALANALAARRALESAIGAELSPEVEPDTGLLDIESTDADSDVGWEIEALERQGDAARHEARMHRMSRVPTLAAFAQTGVAGVNDRVFPMYRLGLSLAVPLWDGGRAVAMGRAADAQAGELDARAQEARVAKEEERRNAIIDREQAEQQLEIANSLISISKKRVDQAKTSYELGAADLEALAGVRAALREAQSRRVRIQVARADAILRLDSDSVAHGILDP